MLLFTCSRPAPGSWQLKERCSSPEAAYRGFSPGLLSCSTSGLYDRTDLNGSMVYTERLENQEFNSYVTPVNQKRMLTYLCEHLEQVWQSSLLLLQYVLHLSLLLLFLCWHVDGEILQVSQVADDLAWQEQQKKRTRYYHCRVCSCVTNREAALWCVLLGALRPDVLGYVKTQYTGCRLAQLVERASHVRGLCTLLCVIPPLSHPVSCHHLQLYYQ